MSGAEVLGVISGAITLIEASIKFYKTAKESSGLPPSLRDAACRLPLIQNSLKLAAQRVQEDCQPTDSYPALEAVLQKCSDRAAQLHDIFRAMIPPTKASRTERYIKAVRSFPQVEKANGLVEEILADLQVLTLNQVVESAARQRVWNSKNSGMEQIVGGEVVVTLYNVGLGRQYVHTGQGSQNVASNTASQINGNFNGGTFSFTQA
ncbi:hypothetical protein FVEN_g6499 [Fusarium venenatum]|uniref:NACHT-NTPase and P-loop NTPases N-terminal domain-containing protein n=1 Tax=Fusarium venenatum TaxID=56646 RepID=A0A2L2SVG2_9HYPO|nr:uncharacterized protein FVRRES_04775 [Fusarium venenatum]KAG8355592.1 hypothetical protein FVEN_g6499 [Fusarium venenatum]KAH6991924.1 hypothetical protein EDB82DRAFT_494739 [Fusarium venenatum]CEI60339.1 unnamed protein product [Fusarium venenatum]